MNLVFIAPFAYSPKATVSARMLPIATALVRRGHRVTVLVPPYDNPSDSARRWDYEGVHVENMRLGTSRPALQYLLLARRLAQATRCLSPDVIHVFKPVGPGALAMWLLYLRGKRRFVVDNDDWEGRGGWIDVNPYPTLQKRFMAWQEAWCLRHARAVTCASEVLQERTHTLACARRSPMPTALLPNGPDDSLRTQVAHAEAQRNTLRTRLGWDGRPVVIYTGTVPFGHDMDIAVAAVRAALPKYPDLRWVIVATGDGLPSLQASIRSAGIDSAVEVRGFMPHEQLVEYLVAADIALYPYRDSNINRAKCSGKVIDYMACAKPMVVSDVGMNRHYIEDERSGLLTPPGDEKAFTNALHGLLIDPSRAAQLGRAAQQRLWQHFGWDGRVGVLEKIYGDAGG
jgi:glycosyltransferase involved in cell wall biosynthesis